MKTSNPVIIITSDESQFIQLNKQEAIQLELKLNVTSKGHELKNIGDELFNFGSSQEQKNCSFIVTNEQYKFIMMLMSKSSWKDCYGL